MKKFVIQLIYSKQIDKIMRNKNSLDYTQILKNCLALKVN